MGHELLNKLLKALATSMTYPFTFEIREVRATKTDKPTLRTYHPQSCFNIARLKAIAQHFDELQYTIYVVSYSEWLAEWKVKNWVRSNNLFNNPVIEVGDVVKVSSDGSKSKFHIIVRAIRKNDGR
jgi:hypothetical protein